MISAEIPGFRVAVALIVRATIARRAFPCAYISGRLCPRTHCRVSCDAGFGLCDLAHVPGGFVFRASSRGVGSQDRILRQKMCPMCRRRRDDWMPASCRDAMAGRRQWANHDRRASCHVGSGIFWIMLAGKVDVIRVSAHAVSEGVQCGRR